jgi:hypothetical protein
MPALSESRTEQALSRVEGTPKIHHRDTEVTEPALNAPTRMVLISFSALSVSPWWRFVQTKPIGGSR